jgi:hypothetical protein
MKPSWKDLNNEDKFLSKWNRRQTGQAGMIKYQLIKMNLNT